MPFFILLTFAVTGRAIIETRFASVKESSVNFESWLSASCKLPEIANGIIFVYG